MKLGTQVKLPDGRVGTVVYNGLDGVGIKWGLHYPNPEDFKGTTGGLFDEDTKPGDWPWYADALLREPWPGCKRNGFDPEDCVGDEFEITRDAEAWSKS